MWRGVVTRARSPSNQTLMAALVTGTRRPYRPRFSFARRWAHIGAMRFKARFHNDAGRLVIVRTIEYSTDEGATAACREFLTDHPKLAGFTLWEGARKVFEEQRRGPKRRPA